MKSAEEIMNVTGSLRDAGKLSGASHHTGARYVAARDAGGLSDRYAPRPQLIDAHLAKVEEWVERCLSVVDHDPRKAPAGGVRPARTPVGAGDLAGLAQMGAAPCAPPPDPPW